MIPSPFMQPASSPTALVIDAKKPPMGPMLVTPNARINGFPVPLRWGRNVIPAPPGVHHIQIFVPWIVEQGKAQITVDNRYQPAPPVYYASPFSSFSRGAIDHRPVKNPGLLGLLLILTPVLVLILAVVAFALFG
ncbi:hypothetical protein ACFTWF_26365 [Rhodococcus sp. NPDC056960]|uniref:hypothetical protein n=1 Tax=Rhodococcus sp. NPDC056960 TaxID=3345982 RepID=UPI0036374915